MRVIGITGGIGAGKTRILEYLESRYRCRILLADKEAGRLQEPGNVCYEKIVELLGKDIVGEDGAIRRDKMAEAIFGDQKLLEAVNGIVHPAVKAYILREIEREREKGAADFFFIEAALLIENGFEELVEEMWYIRADEAVRRRRLRGVRGYSDEKIDAILRAQLSDEQYRAHCRFVVENGGALADTLEQIDRKMGEYLWK